MNIRTFTKLTILFAISIQNCFSSSVLTEVEQTNKKIEAKQSTLITQASKLALTPEFHDNRIAKLPIDSTNLKLIKNNLKKGMDVALTLHTLTQETKKSKGTTIISTTPFGYIVGSVNDTILFTQQVAVLPTTNVTQPVIGTIKRLSLNIISLKNTQKTIPYTSSNPTMFTITLPATQTTPTTSKK